jgi:Vitamin B6 photo-protection and homoeostasis
MPGGESVERSDRLHKRWSASLQTLAAVTCVAGSVCFHSPLFFVPTHPRTTFGAQGFSTAVGEPSSPFRCRPHALHLQVPPRLAVSRHSSIAGATANNTSSLEIVDNQSSPVETVPLSVVTITAADFAQSTRPLRNCSDPEEEDVPSNNKLLFQEVDVLYGRKTAIVYDPKLDRFVPQQKQKVSASKNRISFEKRPTFLPVRYVVQVCRQFATNSQLQIISALSVAFIPVGVTANYYPFIYWRFCQRFVNANLHVLGTQSLLLGLGITKSSATQLGAISTALKWVLKDCLGKGVRMLWAAKMGRKFHSDPKRWRFRSALVFGVGNALEILTYIVPNCFLLFATLANCFKQVSMLTSSSTRTALYNSFRDGSRENIGDITAKGEAQIAVVDLVGTGTGVAMSRLLVKTSIPSIVTAYAVLQTAEIYCVFQTLRAVQYRVLNFERLVWAIDAFTLSTGIGPSSGLSDASLLVNGSSSFIPTPVQMADSEQILFPPAKLAQKATCFGSLGRANLSPTELQGLLQIFAGEKFLLVVGANRKHPQRWQRRRLVNRERCRQVDVHAALQENCHIVLHTDATNTDIVRGTLALVLLRRKLVQASIPNQDTFNPLTVRTLDCFDLVAESCQEMSLLYGGFLRLLTKQGWEPPTRFMLGRVHMRAEWPLDQRSTSYNRGMSSLRQLGKT